MVKEPGGTCLYRHDGNPNPANNEGWEDKGYVITNASDKGLNYNVQANDWANCYYKRNAIDPSYIIDKDGKHYLVYGSWHSGIAALEVDATTGNHSMHCLIPGERKPIYLLTDNYL